MRKLAGINEASVNISLNGTNSQEIKDLMGIFQSDSKPSMPPIGVSSGPKPPIGLDLPDIKPPSLLQPLCGSLCGLGHKCHSDIS